MWFRFLVALAVAASTKASADFTRNDRKLNDCLRLSYEWAGKISSSLINEG
jgi:hypothetical protein